MYIKIVLFSVLN